MNLEHLVNDLKIIPDITEKVKKVYEDKSTLLSKKGKDLTLVDIEDISTVLYQIANGAFSIIISNHFPVPAVRAQCKTVRSYVSDEGIIYI